MEAIVSNLGDMLFKVSIFLVVQGLVYLILSQSSNVFSKTPRSFSFKTARSVSIRRMAALLADVPAGGEFETSPNSSTKNGRLSSLTRDRSSVPEFSDCTSSSSS